MTVETGIPVGLILGTVLTAVLAVVFQVLAAMLERSSSIRLRHWAEEASGNLLALYEDPSRFESFRYILSSLAKVMPAILVAVGAALSLGTGLAKAPNAALVWGVVAASIVLLSTELLSRVLVARNPEKVLRKLTPAYRFFRWVLGPLLALLAPIVGAVSDDNGVIPEEVDDEASEGEIEAFLDVGAKEGILEPGEEDMIMRVIDFGDAVVRSVMTPRIDMVCASTQRTFDELAEAFLESRYSRVPIYEASVDEILGILHIRDLFRAIRMRREGSVRELLIRAPVVPETKPLDELLREMQAGHHQMAIVVDEYGGTAGLVTVEDLLEEIVGEIVDEHDRETRSAVRLSDGSWRIEGKTPLDWLEDTFDVSLEDEPYETVGGLVFGHVGDVPEPGTQIEAHGLRLIVERIRERRIDMLRVERAQGEFPEEQDEPEEKAAG